MTEEHEQPESLPEAAQESEVRFSDFGRAGPAAIVAALMPALGGFILLGSIPVIAPRLRDMGTAGLLLYVAVFAVTSGLAILPTFAQAALGGYAFGLALGLPGALCGFLGGSIIGYFLARGVTGDDALKGVQRHPKWNIVVRSFFPDREGDGAHRGFWRTLGIITLIRFPPNSPFAITNLVLASVKVDLIPFAIGTALGMLPRTAVVAYLGTLVEGEISKDALASTRPGWYLPVGIGVSIAVLLILARLGDLAIKKAVASGEIDAASPEQEPEAPGDQ
ncbi:MAG: TVP38/TMEM64 family protein [Phycisphaerales bacterium]|nr:TVP38/TMEM64 family protein [Phycisphaerales bacterium]MCB9835822.1 TVP38/TMEM64 family protein [Phycisphaera sp.]